MVRSDSLYLLLRSLPFSIPRCLGFEVAWTVSRSLQSFLSGKKVSFPTETIGNEPSNFPDSLESNAAAQVSVFRPKRRKFFFFFDKLSGAVPLRYFCLATSFCGHEFALGFVLRFRLPPPPRILRPCAVLKAHGTARLWSGWIEWEPRLTFTHPRIFVADPFFSVFVYKRSHRSF